MTPEEQEIASMKFRIEQLEATVAMLKERMFEYGEWFKELFK